MPRYNLIQSAAMQELTSSTVYRPKSPLQGSTCNAVCCIRPSQSKAKSFFVSDENSEYEDSENKYFDATHTINLDEDFEDITHTLDLDDVSPTQDDFVEDQPFNFGLQYASLEDAIAAVVFSGFDCSTVDTTMPEDDDKRFEYATQLLVAIYNIDNVNDEQGPVFMKRWFHPVHGRTDYYGVEETEKVCEKLLELAERLHREGIRTLKAMDVASWHKLFQTQKWSFAERIDQIVQLLTVEKACCDKLLGGIGLQAVVSYPDALKAAAQLKHKHNERRERLLRVARASSIKE